MGGVNQLVLLYGVVDFYGRHLVSSGIIEVKNGEVKVLVKRDRLGKADRKIFDDFFKVLYHLNTLEDSVYEAIKQKWMRINKSVMNFKGIQNGYAAVIVGLALLDAYARMRNKKVQIHPKRIEKILALMKKEAKIEGEKDFKLLDELVLNSFSWADKILNQLGVKNAKAA
jgi:hypothetical protein